jgi:hypothetical protein
VGNNFPYRHALAGLAQNGGYGATGRGGDFHVDFIRLELSEYFSRLDHIADLLVPARNRPLDNRFAKYGYFDFHTHDVFS